MHWLAVLNRHRLPGFSRSFVLIRTDVVFVSHLLVSLLWFCLLVGKWHRSLWLLGLRSGPRQGNILLVVKLVVQLEVVVVQNDLDDALQGILTSVQKAFESV